MNFFVLAPLTAAIINSFLGVFVFARSPHSHPNRIYLLFSVCLVTWNLGVLIMFFAETPEAALTISRALHFGVIFLPFLLLHVVFLILKIPLKKSYLLTYIIPVTLSGTNFTDFFIKEVKESGYSYYGVAGPGFHIFSFFLVLIFILFFAAVIRKRKTAVDFEKQKVNSLILAYFTLLFSGIHDTLPVFEIYRYPIIGGVVYPLGMIGSIIFAVLLAYGVLQHQVLSIYTSLGRVAATCARLFLLFLVFFLSILSIALIFPDKFSYFSLFTSILIFLTTVTLGSVVFPKLIGLGEEHIEKRLLGDRFEYQDRIRTLTTQILYYTSEKSLYNDLHEVLTHTFQFRTYAIFILDEKSESFYLQQSHPARPTEDSCLLPANSTIARRLERGNNNFLSSINGKEVLHLEDIDDADKTSLRNLAVKLCFPLRSGGELLGFLMVGEKSGNRPITKLDLTLFLEMTDKLGLFINQSRLSKQVALAQELELLGNLSRGLAHDLNNLITPISTYWQLAPHSPGQDESMREFAVIAKKNLATMQSYIQKALFFSTSHEPQVREVDVLKLFKGIETICQSRLTAKNMQLVISCPDGLEMVFDEVLMERLFSNLILNAVDASPDGSRIDLTITHLNRSLLTRKWVRFSVQDQGSGIPESEIDKVFTPYFTTKTTGDNKRGPGLGLAICRRIVDLHQGTITIHSQVGVGTRVEVDLPSDPLPTLSESSAISAQL